MPLVLLFTEALFALGIFLGSVNIGGEIIWDLRKGVGQRDFGDVGLRLDLQCPAELTTLTMPPF